MACMYSFHVCLMRPDSQRFLRSLNTVNSKHAIYMQSTFHLFKYMSWHVPCQVIHDLDTKGIYENEAFPARLRYVVKHMPYHEICFHYSLMICPLFACLSDQISVIWCELLQAVTVSGWQASWLWLAQMLEEPCPEASRTQMIGCAPDQGMPCNETQT